ncbi:hypothetical protein Pla110_20100 [Polystyrenella longa]|uniref:Uncharacterized protein n=1 Tax=Polystyrenella longa TaxID=2528007 RepID=A0A518CM71_9PLAN|nr:hypothetical protein [Polystyrenella longa]QDU80284.1 hypothetical protein Pla110_20100 [Polystyrenella longa]
MNGNRMCGSVRFRNIIAFGVLVISSVPLVAEEKPDSDVIEQFKHHLEQQAGHQVRAAGVVLRMDDTFRVKSQAKFELFSVDPNRLSIQFPPYKSDNPERANDVFVR